LRGETMTLSTDALNWLTRHRLKEVIRYEYTWALVFDEGAGASIECLWRLLENGRIRLTSEDDGHQFGLPAPVDADRRIREAIVGASVTGIVLHEGTLDLELRFENGYALQLIPTSSGYEAWNFYNSVPENFVAVGGGDLAIFRPRQL